jgi:hypothetical protein
MVPHTRTLSGFEPETPTHRRHYSSYRYSAPLAPLSFATDVTVIQTLEIQSRNPGVNKKFRSTWLIPVTRDYSLNMLSPLRDAYTSVEKLSEGRESECAFPHCLAWYYLTASGAICQPQSSRFQSRFSLRFCCFLAASRCPGGLQEQCLPYGHILKALPSILMIFSLMYPS